MKEILLIISIIMLLPFTSKANDCKFIMDQERMEIVINQMKNQSDDTKKFNIIKTYLQRLCINTSQMVSILAAFESKETQTDFFLYSKNFITDIDNYNQIKLN